MREHRRTHLAFAAALALLGGTAAAERAGETGPLAGITVHRDVTYATTAHGPLRLDVYKPAEAHGPRPVLLFLHGGGWIVGSRSDALPDVYPAPSYPDRRWPSMLPYVRRGLALVSLDYRLAAEAPAPAAVEDCRRGFDWISRHGADYGLDPTRVVTIGASAGGHLALMVAFTNGGRAEHGPGRVIGAVDLYGITDVPPLLEPPTQRSWARDWIGSAPDAAARARAVSPLRLVRAGLPPVLIAHSLADDVVPYDQGRRLAEALRAAGVGVELLTFPTAVHGFFTPAELAQLEDAIMRFLARVGVLASQGEQKQAEDQKHR
jgi:acetyl esterase/lipase